MAEWYDSQKMRSGNLRKLLHERIEKSNPRRKLTTEEALTHNRWRCEMKSYDELKAEMEAIQQQMDETKKNERVNALKGVKRLCKESGFTAGMAEGLVG